MPYIADMKKVNAFQQAKQLVGNGQCVSLIHAVTVIPPASLWHQGAQVISSKASCRGPLLRRSTAMDGTVITPTAPVMRLFT